VVRWRTPAATTGSRGCFAIPDHRRLAPRGRLAPIAPRP